MALPETAISYSSWTSYTVWPFSWRPLPHRSGAGDAKTRPLYTHLSGRTVPGFDGDRDWLVLLSSAGAREETAALRPALRNDSRTLLIDIETLRFDQKPVHSGALPSEGA